MTVNYGEATETGFLYQCISVFIQRYNAVLLYDGLPDDPTDWRTILKIPSWKFSNGDNSHHQIDFVFGSIGFSVSAGRMVQSTVRSLGKFRVIRSDPQPVAGRLLLRSPRIRGVTLFIGLCTVMIVIADVSLCCISCSYYTNSHLLLSFSHGIKQ